MKRTARDRIRIRRTASTLDVSCATFGLHHATFLVAGAGVAAAAAILFEGGKALGLAALGAGFAYHGLAGTANRVRLRIDDGELRVRYGPLPWRRGVRLAAGSIQEIRVEARSTTYSQEDGEDVKRRGYDLLAADGRRDHLLVKDLDRARDADLIASELRDFLGLPHGAG